VEQLSLLNTVNLEFSKSQQNGCETPVSRKFSFKSLSSNSFAAISTNGKVSHKMTSPAPRQNHVTRLIWIPELNVTRPVMRSLAILIKLLEN